MCPINFESSDETCTERIYFVIGKRNEAVNVRNLIYRERDNDGDESDDWILNGQISKINVC